MLSFRGILKLSMLGALAYTGAGYFGFLRDANDPVASTFEVSVERRMAKLPENGRVPDTKLPWSDSPWLASRMGINRAWRLEPHDSDRSPSAAREQDVESTDLRVNAAKINLPSLKELRGLSPTERSKRIADLPASVKFDLARMNFSFPTYRAESARLVKAEPNAHLLAGWALASTKLKEPAATNYTVHASQDFSFDVPFYSSDVKSIIAWYLSNLDSKKLDRKVLGRMQGTTSAFALDPATFHVAIANIVGRDQKPLILEFGDSLNHSESRPIVAFESDMRIETRGSYRVSMTVEFTKLRLPQEGPYGIQNWETDQAVFDYRLEVDSSGKIVRGSWISEHAPLALWDARIPKLEAGFELLEDIYKAD